MQVGHMWISFYGTTKFPLWQGGGAWFASRAVLVSQPQHKRALNQAPSPAAYNPGQYSPSLYCGQSGAVFITSSHDENPTQCVGTVGSRNLIYQSTPMALNICGHFMGRSMITLPEGSSITRPASQVKLSLPKFHRNRTHKYINTALLLGGCWVSLFWMFRCSQIEFSWNLILFQWDLRCSMELLDRERLGDGRVKFHNTATISLTRWNNHHNFIQIMEL